jgi:hypothetical protein
MNPAYISAFAALAGSIIGGLTSLATSWVTQRTQARAGELTRNRRRREKLYGQFIDEASRLYIDALGRDEAQASEQAAELVKIYSVVSQMRVLSSRRVIQAAENIVRKIVDTTLRQRRRSRNCEKWCIMLIRSIHFASSAKRAGPSSKMVRHLTDSPRSGCTRNRGAVRLPPHSVANQTASVGMAPVAILAGVVVAVGIAIVAVGIGA